MEHSIPSVDAESSRLVVRPQAVSTGTPTSDQYPCVGHPAPLVSPFASDDCTTEDPPDRSSFDSLLILPEPGGPPSVQTAQQVKPYQPHPRLSTLRTWFLEILNSFLLLIAVSAIVATLYIHDGQPLPQWPFDITINAMLSIYAVVLKASMAFILTSCIGQSQWRWFNSSSRSLQDLVLFHDAGQGPWGSISWLWAYRLGQPVAALGAFITIVGMAVDPFVQQLIHPVDCMEQLQGAPAASVPTTNIITYGGLPDALQPSVVGGFYTSQNLTDVECSTGNCTFADDYTTLGFCSSCEDVSDKVTITTNCTVEPYNDSKPYRGPCDARPRGPVIWDITTTSPPFNLNFYDRMNVSFIMHGAKFYADEGADVFSMESTERWVPDLLNGTNGDSELKFGVDLGVIYGMSDNSVDHVEPGNPTRNVIGCGDASTNNTWYCRGYGAAMCLMQPCLRTYSARVDAGRLTETLVEHTDPAADWGYSQVDDGEFVGGSLNEKGYFGLVDKGCISNDQHQQLATAGYNGVGETQTRWLPYKVTYDPTRPNATAYNTTLSASLLASRCLFLVEELFVDRMWNEVLDASFLGTVKRRGGLSNPLASKAGDVGRPSILFTGPDPLRYLWNSGRVNMTRINDSMANLAQALTLWVRSAGAKGRGGGQEEFFSTRFTGQVLHYATCAQVTWAWIALPASLTALTLLCLAATMVTTARGRVPVWKSSPLTVLFHGPGGRYWVDEGLLAAATTKKSAATIKGSATTIKRSDGDNIMAEKGMEKFASRVSVKLGDNGGQGELRLRQVAPASKKRRWWERKNIR